MDFKKLLPGILTGVSISCFISAIFTSAAATPKAFRLMEAERETKGEPLTTTEVISVCAKPYAVTAGLALVGAGTAIAACIMQYKTVSGLINAAAVAETAYINCKQLLERKSNEIDIYKQKAVEVVGEEVEKSISDRTAAEMVKFEPPQPTYMLPPPDMVGKLYYEDEWTGQRFWTTEKEISDHVLWLNQQLQDGIDVDLNDYLSGIGARMVKDTPGGDLKWEADDNRIIKVRYGSKHIGPDESIFTVNFAPGHGPRGRIVRD